MVSSSHTEIDGYYSLSEDEHEEDDVGLEDVALAECLFDKCDNCSFYALCLCKITHTLLYL